MGDHWSVGKASCVGLLEIGTENSYNSQSSLVGSHTLQQLN